MWQKCPVCNGTGVHQWPGTFNTALPRCQCCKGAMIISEISGLPPDHIINDYSNSTEDVIERLKTLN